VAEVAVSFVFAQPIDAVWRILRDFNSIASWLPGAVDGAIENGLAPDQIGAIRRFTLNGAIIREKLLTLSDLDHACAYSLLEGPPSLRNMIADFRLYEITEIGGTFGYWRAKFDVREQDRLPAMEQLQKLYSGGWSNLKKILAGQPSLKE